MKTKILAAILCLLFLNSCSLARTLIQVPVRTLQSVGRTVGMGIEKSEGPEQQPLQFRHSRDHHEKTSTVPSEADLSDLEK